MLECTGEGIREVSSDNMVEEVLQDMVLYCRRYDREGRQMLRVVMSERLMIN